MQKRFSIVVLVLFLASSSQLKAQYSILIELAIILSYLKTSFSLSRHLLSRTALITPKCPTRLNKWIIVGPNS